MGKAKIGVFWTTDDARHFAVECSACGPMMMVTTDNEAKVSDLASAHLANTHDITETEEGIV